MNNIMTLSLCLCLSLISLTAMAVEPSEMLKDPILEQRARIISKELRCLVCQNENIDDSNAALAKDLRVLIRERLKMGETDHQIIAFVHEKYGDFVLMTPPVQKNTFILWFLPIFMAFFGSLLLYRLYFRQNTDHSAQKATK